MMTKQDFLSGKPFKSVRSAEDAPCWECISVIQPHRRVVQMVGDPAKGMWVAQIRSDGYVKVMPYYTVGVVKWLYLPDLISIEQAK